MNALNIFARLLFAAILCGGWIQFPLGARAAEGDLRLRRDANWLVLAGSHLPGGELRVNYLEAYCRPNSTDADWEKTVIRHTSALISTNADGTRLELRDTLSDGVMVDHVITSEGDSIRFELVAVNPTSKISEAHWAQACPRLGKFTGFGTEDTSGDLNDYLPQCFIFLDGVLTRMPMKPWAEKARYVPGQTWCPKNVPRTDVNPRPLSPLVPSNGLIGCFSADEKWIFATAWEPYQELFQGVARCLHADFRIGGLRPGESKKIQGRIYIVPNDVPALLKRYERDFRK
jgi:hypothetical protein